MSELISARSGVTDAVAMIGRSLRLSRRNLDVLLMSLLLPVILMLMFVYLFGGAIETGTEYVSYVVPGVLVLCAGFGSSTTAVSVTTDMTNGVMDRPRDASSTFRPSVRACAVAPRRVSATVRAASAHNVMMWSDPRRSRQRPRVSSARARA